MASESGPVCVSVINMKGGVGKTTIAALLARYASRRLGLDVLAIDLDPQANLSQAFMGEDYRNFLRARHPSIVEIFDGFLPPSADSPAPRPLNVDDVVVGVTRLGGQNLQIIPSRFDFSNELIGSIGKDTKILANLISRNFRDKDIIFIDCAPTESIFTQVAYQASRYILVPVRPEYFATIGFPLLNESLTEFKRNNKNRDHAIDVVGVVINHWTYPDDRNIGKRDPETTRSIEDIQEESTKSGWHVFEKEVEFSRGFPKIMRGDFSRLGDAMWYFDAFAKEFFDRLGCWGNRK